MDTLQGWQASLTYGTSILGKSGINSALSHEYPQGYVNVFSAPHGERGTASNVLWLR